MKGIFTSYDRMYKKLCFLLLMVCCGSAVHAQQHLLLKGVIVSSENNQAVPGATVRVAGTDNGTLTDYQGKYSLSASTGDTLIISSLGFVEKRLLVGNQTTLNMRLQPTANRLNELVVVSYGTSRERDITGSVTKVSAQAVQDLPVAEFGQKLQGKVAGLQANQVTGIPGEGMTFRIRGAASLGAGNQPLIVVDGQPITGDVTTINPDDIESFSVLKDASATALYGSRAANGVIIITTKHAKIGSTSVSLNAYYGVQQVPQQGRPDLMNAREFATFMKGFYEDKIKYEGWKDPSTGLAQVPKDYQNPDQYGVGTNWYNALLRNAPIQNYSLNVSSGTERVSSSTSLNYFDQQGVLLNTDARRFSFRSNNEYRPIDRVKLGLNISPTYQMDHNTLASIDGNRQIVSGAEISSPLIPVRNPDGSYTTKTSSYGMYALPNFVQQMQQMDVNENRFRLLANAYADIEIIQRLHFRSTINTDMGAADYNSFYPSTYGIFGSPPPRQASASSSSNNYTSWLNENMLTYNFTVNHHNFDFLAGYSAQKYSMNYRSISGTGFPNDEIPWISAAATTSGTSNTLAWAMASWYGRMNYNYKDKYYISANIRGDGSSRFGDYKKWAYFPSVSAGWVVSDEKFFPGTRLISFLKLRGSYGLTGNNNIGNYTQISLVGTTNYSFNDALAQGLSITSLGNKELTWETSRQTDAGIDVNLINDRITFSYDYYNKTTSGMLYSLSIPYGSGYSSIAYNVGTFRIWGHEFQVNSKNLTGAFSWNTGFNISFNDNKVLSLQNNTPIGGTHTYNDYNRTAVGHPIGELWGYVFDGIYMNQKEFDSDPKSSSSAVGSARMKDINGDGVIDANDKTFLGNPNPKFIFGMTNSFQYRNFDLNVIIAGQAGNKIMNINLQNLDNLDGIFNMEKSMANRWRSEQDPGNGKVPSTRANTTELYRLGNSVQVFSGDFLTVKNITLGYTLSQHVVKFAKGLRIYAGIQQAFVFTKYPGQNPEVNMTRDNQTTAGLDNGSFPVPRTFLIGTNVNF